MLIRQSIQTVLGLVFLVSSSFALSNTEYTFINHPDGIEITGCVSTCSSVLVVPETIDGVTVTRIGAGAFVSANLDSLTLPNTIKHIGGEAFIDSGLDSIIIPNSVVNTGFDTFEDFDGDVFVIKPAEQRFSVYDFSSSSNVYACEPVDSSGFPFNCTNAYPDITRVELDRETAMTLIDSNGHANVPSIYTMISDAAFAMSSLSSITLPNTIKHIGDEAFIETNLSSLILPSSVESISRGTLPEFEGDIYIMKPAEQNFNAYDFPFAANIYACNGIDSTGSPADCIDAYPEVNRTVIDYQTASSLIDSNGHAEIPNVYNMIADGTFTMSNLESITIPNSIKHIGGEAFAGANLSSVVIPSSVVSLAENSLDFEGNIFFIRPSEEQINYYDLSNPEKVFVCDFDETSCIPIWDDINSSSLALSNTEFTYNVIDGGVEVTGCEDECPIDLVIPPEIDGLSVVEIENQAFIDKQLISISIPSSVTTIYGGAFANNELFSIELPENLNLMTDGSFAENQLTEINIPDSLSKIPYAAFRYNQLTEVTLNDNLIEIGMSAFAFNLLPYIEIPANVITIEKYAFRSNQLKRIKFIGNRPAIDSEAYVGNQLEEIFYCSDSVGWPGDPIEGIVPQLDESCSTTNAENQPITYSALDLDQNGSFDALTDALILLRYAFGLRGDNLINGAIASDATRTSASEIETHIQSLLP
jgi:hypothetical protein